MAQIQGHGLRAATRQPILLQKKPEWFKVRRREGENYRELKQLMREGGLHTVCEEAHCPNIYECWEQRTATFMILGDTCTRACRFCSVKWGRPSHVDRLEPRRVAAAVAAMGLKFAVVTSVNRDDLHDGGAGIFADTIRAIRENVPGCGVEVLIPDFQGNWEALALVVDAQPEILNHNVETVPRLFRRIQPWDSYESSLELFRQVRARDPRMIIKTGVMLGLGETREELIEVMRDLRACDVDVLTIGQYLPPSHRHFPLQRYYTLEEFDDLRQAGLELGFGHVESGPLVRSSYHARDQAEALTLRRLQAQKQANAATAD
ncbi:MAG TPA: lipoyl synthase [Thermomicrobiaceae bacterium]|nr:lipoyl synthase [Thermomicrobiaceae bacterium]